MNQLIIFSKNRACQLHLCLESFLINSSGLFDDIKVIYTCDKLHEESYDLLRTRVSKVWFIRETDFREDLIEQLTDDYEYTSFCVDDAVLYKKIYNINIDKDNLCFSLRLGLNCTYSYPINLNCSVINETIIDDKMEFIPKHQLGDFAYPLSTDGHIFRTSELRDMISKVNFKDPNTMEASWQSLLQTVNNRRVSCYTHSHLVSIPNNRVNTSIPNKYGVSFDTSELELHNMYMNGYIIDLYKLDFSKIIGAHQEIEFVYRRYNDKD